MDCPLKKKKKKFNKEKEQEKEKENARKQEKNRRTRRLAKVTCDFSNILSITLRYFVIFVQELTFGMLCLFVIFFSIVFFRRVAIFQSSPSWHWLSDCHRAESNIYISASSSFLSILQLSPQDWIANSQTVYKLSQNGVIDEQQKDSFLQNLQRLLALVEWPQCRWSRWLNNQILQPFLFAVSKVVLPQYYCSHLQSLPKIFYSNDQSEIPCCAILLPNCIASSFIIALHLWSGTFLREVIAVQLLRVGIEDALAQN